MRLLAYARSLAIRLFHRSRMNEDTEEELRSHIQHRADDLERSGLDRAEAERRARIEFGGQERFKEECHEALGGSLIESLAQDVRVSLRVLRKSPGFTIVAVLTLALAIGANAVVFGVLNGLILRPLTVPQAETLYGIEHGNEHNMYESYPDYLDLRDRNRSFDGLAAFDVNQVGLDTGGEATRAWVTFVTGNYFDVLRIRPPVPRLRRARPRQRSLHRAQPRVLVDPFPRRPRRAGPHRSREQASVHHRRRRSAGVPRRSDDLLPRFLPAAGEPGAG